MEYESHGQRNKNMLVKEYLNETELYLKDIIIDLQRSGTWKSQLTTAINFVSSKDTNEEQVMHSKSSNIEFMSYNNADEISE